jgi:cytidylate kinase
VERQRTLGSEDGIVMEGRDIGTVVFPDAKVKIFLDAPPEVRSQRRMRDMESAAGLSSETILREITERDRRDQTREVSPLVPAPDAVRIDTSRLSFDQVIAQVLELARSRRHEGVEKTAGNQ